jgi:hypothetical protein
MLMGGTLGQLHETPAAAVVAAPRLSLTVSASTPLLLNASHAFLHTAISTGIAWQRQLRVRALGCAN